MKKIATLALLATAAIASPAMAQTVTGTINITGTVQAKCLVVPGNGNTFGTTVAMGELSQADGTLKASGTLSSTFATVGGTGLTAQVVCTSANPDVSVLSEPLVNTVAADPGYDNSVDYTADVTFTRVGGTTLVSDPSAVPAATTATLASRLTGTGTNVSVATSGWTASGVLVAGSYAGKITIVIAPGV
ncbi:MAG: hypothetical protein WBL74_07595 [Novosphingobium sp.]|uniref:hypothetical protein n=1 Tax=Novosphingobium sp. TaxID=1874826 RepID=UPI003C79BEA9